MNPSPAQRELTVFPTGLALRRFQQHLALAQGWVDASNHTTFARLRALCLPHAGMARRRMREAERLLVRRQAVEVAQGHFDGGPLGELSDAALGAVLDRLVDELAMLPESALRIADWLLGHPRGHKLHQLGVLYSVWRATLQQEGLADALDANAAILRLLRGDREKWPPLLRTARRLVFRGVRWFNPFDESCVVALNHKLKVRIESALPPAHAELSADRLGQRIRAGIMAEPWAGWTEDLGDALAVGHPGVLQFEDVGRIGFSRSAGAYGEIEDLARRIGWAIRERGVAPDRIALVVPDLGTIQDIVPHVFGRFRIPYFFRRGRPAPSSPCVKAFLAWLAFPLRPERDALVDLVRNPAIRFGPREETVQALMGMPPRLGAEQASLPVLGVFRGSETCSGRRALEILDERIAEPDDHFNRQALAALRAALEAFGATPMPLRELVALVEELLANETVRPRDSHEQGVWILNPHDAVDLSFDLVLFAGLNEGEFPAVPRQDALLGDAERSRLRSHLEAQGIHLPRLALPSADAAAARQSAMFLAALGMARENLVFSCQAVGEEGNERGESEFYRKLWNLAGWAAQDPVPLDPYDQWRIGRLAAPAGPAGGEGEGTCAFSRHWRIQQDAAPEARVPMPGESFLQAVPLPLCRARDEALQTAVRLPAAPPSGTAAAPDATIIHVGDMLRVEAEREAFLECAVRDRTPSVHCGFVGSQRERVAAWFDSVPELGPTALETLAGCRYLFLLERVFGLRDERTPDDLPDPMDRGGLVHDILRETYSALAAGEAVAGMPRRWAVRAAGGWRLGSQPGEECIPLVAFEPACAGECLAFARATAERRLAEAELGHPAVWAAEREKVLQQVVNVVRHDAGTCAEEGRFPALFEFRFGKESAVVLSRGGETVRLRGTVDRIDLLFDPEGGLRRVRVLDYKGASRKRGKPEDYMDDIRRNFDCQLPVYAFAAQQRFFGECNTPEANAMTEAGYLFYERDCSKVAGGMAKSLVPMDADGLAAGFLDTLFNNIRLLKAGDFAVDPLVETYTDRQSVCRTRAVGRDEVD